MDSQKNKFEPGNLLSHSPTGSKWISLSFLKCEGTGSTAYLLLAYCVYTGLEGLKPSYWEVGQVETFRLTPKDLNNTLWIAKNQV